MKQLRKTSVENVDAALARVKLIADTRDAVMSLSDNRLQVVAQAIINLEARIRKLETEK